MRLGGLPGTWDVTINYDDKFCNVDQWLTGGPSDRGGERGGGGTALATKGGPAAAGKVSAPPSLMSMKATITALFLIPTTIYKDHYYTVP